METKNLTESEQFTLAATRAISELFKAMNAEHFRSGAGTVTKRLYAAENYLNTAKRLGVEIDNQMADATESRKTAEQPAKRTIPQGRDGLEFITGLVIGAAKEANHDYDSHAAGPVRGQFIDQMNDELLAAIDEVEGETADPTNIERALFRELRHVVRYFCRCRNQGHYDGKVRRVHGYKAA